MLRSNIVEISCPNCKNISKIKIWSNINKLTNPNLREDLLNENLFSWQCPQCAYSSKIFYSLLYHDPELNFMIYLSPHDKQNIFIDKSILQSYPSIKNIKKRSVTSTNSLKEKILVFESGLNDLILETTKLSLSKIVEKSLHTKVLEIYFCAIDPSRSRLGFLIFTKDYLKPYYQTTNIESYNQMSKIVKEYTHKIANSNSAFLNIDSTWAQNVLEYDFSE